MHVLVHDERRQLTLIRVARWRQSLARLRAARLDRQLAGGTRPESDILLAIRAMQLTSARMRAQLAASIGSVVSAERPKLVAVRHRVAVEQAAGSLADLSDALLGDRPVPARGVALVVLLLADGTGPLYRPGRPGELGTLIGQAIGALTQGERAVAYP